MLDKKVTFTRVVSKLNFLYNTGVTQIEFNDTEEVCARQREYSPTPDTEKTFILKPGQQIVGIYGKLK